jgi:hypothetical protein
LIDLRSRTLAGMDCRMRWSITRVKPESDFRSNNAKPLSRDGTPNKGRLALAWRLSRSSDTNFKFSAVGLIAPARGSRHGPRDSHRRRQSATKPDASRLRRSTAVTIMSAWEDRIESGRCLRPGGTRAIPIFSGGVILQTPGCRLRTPPDHTGRRRHARFGKLADHVAGRRVFVARPRQRIE